MDFYIKKGSTLPILKLELINDGRTDYGKFYEDLQNSTITFSMRNKETKALKIGNKTASTYLLNNNLDNEEYLIGYQFTEKDTNTVGVYEGNFTIAFNNNQGTLEMPIQDKLYIHVVD